MNKIFRALLAFLTFVFLVGVITTNLPHIIEHRYAYALQIETGIAYLASEIGLILS